MIRPPTSGPAMVAIPMTAPRNPKTRARSCGGNVTCTMLSTWGYISAAIPPWRTRERSSISALWASPQSAEASTNPPMPSMSRRLRPKMSPRRPPVMRITA